VHLILIFGVYESQLLVRVGQDVEDEGGRVFQIHFLLLTQFDDLVHQLPCFVQGALVGGQFGRSDSFRESPVKLGQDRRNVFVLARPPLPRRHNFACFASLEPGKQEHFLQFLTLCMDHLLIKTN
jgi:hypothetical protein